MGQRRGFKRPHKGDLNRFAIRGVPDGTKMPDNPTDALPGSKAKAAVMRKRLERGEHPHHPLDARDRDDLPGMPPAEQCSDGVPKVHKKDRRTLRRKKKPKGEKP